MKAVFSSILGILLCVASAAASAYGDLNELRSQAEQGDAWAQSTLCVYYDMGIEPEEIPQDDEKAFKWCSMAAEQGSATAAHTLGHMYEEGRGVARNLEESRKWFRRAIESDNLMELHLIGTQHLLPIHGGDDHGGPEMAAMWWRPAAERGEVGSQFSLSFIYFWGNERTGFPRDLEEALKWARMAAESGHPDSRNGLGCVYYQGYETIARDYDEALKWFRLGADQDDPTAQTGLGRMHEEGKGVAQSYEEAKRWYRLAADSGDEYARHRLDILVGGSVRDAVEDPCEIKPPEGTAALLWGMY